MPVVPRKNTGIFLDSGGTGYYNQNNAGVPAVKIHRFGRLPRQ